MDSAKPKRLIFDSKLKAEKEYWLQKLPPDSGVSSIPADFQKPIMQSGMKRTITLLIPDELSKKLIEFAGGSLLSLYTTLMTGLKVSLRKYTGNDSIIVGSPPYIEGHKPNPESNVVAIVDDVARGLSFQQLMVNVRETLLEAYENQSYPFNHLLSDLGPDGEENRRRLFDIILKLENIHGESPEIQNGITLIFNRSGEAITLKAEYSEDRFRRESIERFARHLMNLLDAATQNAAAPISELELLSAVEREQILVEWSRAEFPFSLDLSVHQLFEEIAVLTPDATALIFENLYLSYRELDERSNQLARYLKARGVGPELRIAICVDRSLDMIIAILAVLKSGAAYVPLDPAYPKERLTFMFEDCQAQALLTQQDLLERLPESDIPPLRLDADWPAVTSHSRERLPNEAGPGNLAYVIYTSGSTGKPKGVLIEHRGLSNLVQAQMRAFGVRADSRVLQFASFSFDASVSEIFMALCSGATLHLGRERGPDVTEVLGQEAITVVTLPPAALTALDGAQLPALESVVAAGEACPAEVVERWGHGRRFFNAYGPTENTVCASLLECRQSYSDYVPIGRPMANTQLYVLDADCRIAPVLVNGELYIGGAGQARGYMARPGLTAEKFIPHPFSQEHGARLYRTGDIVRYLEDGNIEFIGRHDQQVKLRGYRIELGEIEAVLRRQEGIKEAVVQVRQDGRGQRRLIAYFVSSGSEAAGGAEELRAGLKQQLPDYMMPSMFVALKEMPLTSSGKVDRRALPEPEPDQNEATYEAPVTDTEREVADIWADVLGVEKVGRGEDFFRLGGHSLLASQVTARVHDSFGVELPVYDLFENSTVAEFAQHLDTIRWTAEDLQFSVDSARDGREEGEV